MSKLEAAALNFLFLIKLWNVLLCSAAVTCNQLAIITALLSAPGSWINKNPDPPPPPNNHLKVIPLSATSIIISDTTGCFLDPEKPSAASKESLIRPLQANHCYFTPFMTLIPAQLNWTYCFRAGKLVLCVDWLVSFESKILKKTYHHPFAWAVVYRLPSIDDDCIERSLISGFCVEDKWGERRAQRCRSKWEKAWWVNI